MSTHNTCFYEEIQKISHIYRYIKENKTYLDLCAYLQGAVVQSGVSLSSSLRVISLTVLADSIYNILIVFVVQKLNTFFSAKNFSIFVYHSM